MIYRYKSNLDNIFVGSFTILICLIFASLYNVMANISVVLKWIFIILTAGFFYYMGGNLVDQGYFRHKYLYKIILFFFLPLIFMFEMYIISNLTWYTELAAFSYFFLFYLGYFFKKIPQNYKSY